MGTIKVITLDQLHLDPAIQPRERLCNQVVQEYATLYREGHTLSPIQIFQDGHDDWLGDGFHRVAAAREAGLSELEAEVTVGSRRDAMLYACAANTHGLPRTSDDKRRVVMRLLDDSEWGQWSDMEIARHCGVAHSFVAKVRRSLDSESSETGARTYRSKHGTVATMQTRRIGRNTPAEANDTPEQVRVPEAPEHAQVEDDALPISTADADPLVHERGGAGTHEVLDPAVVARTDSPAASVDLAIRQHTPESRYTSPDHDPQRVLGLMEALCEALLPVRGEAAVVIANTWSPTFTEQYQRVCTALLERLMAWQDALQQVDPAAVSQMAEEDLTIDPAAPHQGRPDVDMGEDDLAALPEPPLAPSAVAVSDTCGSEPHPSHDLDACGWCGSNQLFRPAESGRVYCQSNGCRAVYNPSTGHWHLGDGTKAAATVVPEPTPDVPLTLNFDADVDGLPLATEVDLLAVTPGNGADPETPVGEYQDDILRLVKALQTMGASLRAIAVQFNEEGVPTLSGTGRWDSGTLSRLLRRGERTTHGSRPDGGLPPAA